MKMRTAGLVALTALAVLLAFCAEGTAVRPAASATTPSEPPAPQAGTAAPATRLVGVGPARFPHDKHATELGIECVTCHHEINAKPLSLPHPEYFKELWIDCSICHHEAGAATLAPQACSTCHHAKDGDIADETLSAKVVIHKKCWSCHEVERGAAASSTCKGCHSPGR